MKKDRELPPGVFLRGRWYCRAKREGKKIVWIKLTQARDGLAVLYAKMAELHKDGAGNDRIPALAAHWLREISTTHKPKTQANDKWVMAAISEAFAEFRACQVTPPDVVTWLKRYREKPRTHNEMRAGMRELMRFAEAEGYRDAGTNPVDSVKTAKVQKRDRYPTDSEIRRIKAAACRGADGKRTRMGTTLAGLIDLAYLTGQRIGDLLELRWSKKAATEDGQVIAPFVAEDGLYFKPSKTSGSTGAKVRIEWTPRLQATIERFRSIGRRNLTFVVTNQEAQRYDYEAFKSAWARALERSGVKDLHFHDLRAKALTDTDAEGGIKAAQTMGAHSTQTQTASYIRHRKAQSAKATK
ncbi:tyrosine-type recombinase/integrase [Ramlibacter sp. MAHUQ-53]|uniref:tyrosine-type recombinase/integrase n=1 Tax=unclassified Ramlibacter TaxID=2617605 RepID=UPI003627E3A5